MKVGISLPQNPGDGAAGWPDIRDLAQLAAAGGADSVWVADHFFHRAPDHELARYGDAWQAAWFGVPDASFREQRSRLDDACGLEGRSHPPQVHVGVNVGGDPDDPQVASDAAAVADALGAWAAEGVAHVQLGAWPATARTWEPVLEGIGRFRRDAASD